MRRLACLCLFALAACNEKVVLSSYGQIPNFALTDQHGAAFSQQRLQGKVVVVDFIFTTCPDVCPLLTEQLAKLRKQLPETAPIGLLSFSVDPEHDTPERLLRFAAQHGADRPDWWFLTGPIDQIKTIVTHAFKQAMDAQPTAAGAPRNVLHGTHFVLVDKTGQIRGFFRSDAEGQASLRVAVLSLVAEGKST